MSKQPDARSMDADAIALGLDSASIRRDFAAKLFFELAKFPGVATRNDHYLALAYVVRDRLLHRWVRSARSFLEREHRTELIEHEEEPGLGNGGLGRLAACFMDSLATLGLPAIGHGIRYEFGIFDQEIRDGWQVEKTDMWLRPGFPWEIRRYGIEHAFGFGGRTEHTVDEKGAHRARWIPSAW
jgi:starch phosphorylase